MKRDVIEMRRVWILKLGIGKKFCIPVVPMLFWSGITLIHNFELCPQYSFIHSINTECFPHTRPCGKGVG